MPTTRMTGAFLGMTLTLTSESGGKWPDACARKTAGAVPAASNPIASTTGRAFMAPNLLHLVAGSMVGGALKCQELVSASTDRKSTRLNSSHGYISYAVFCL